MSVVDYLFGDARLEVVLALPGDRLTPDLPDSMHTLIEAGLKGYAHWFNGIGPRRRVSLARNLSVAIAPITVWLRGPREATVGRAPIPHQDPPNR